MICGACQTENGPGRRFCAHCGSPLARPCESCGFENAPTDRFCGGCGKSLVQQQTLAPAKDKDLPVDPLVMPTRLGERVRAVKASLEGQIRQVTILFADLRGSTSMIAGLDPEAALARLDPLLQVMVDTVHRYEGTVCQLLGDGIMALFGAPVAHEDHAVRACYAALAMQRQIAEIGDRALQLRVGLNSGEVLARALTTDLGLEYGAVGSAVHLAARMEQMAENGTIQLSANTWRLCDGFIEAVSLGLHEIKGLDEPIEIFRLEGAANARGRWQGSRKQALTAYVGRQAERQALQDLLQRVVDGHGQVVALVGDPGIGKSRLVHELLTSPAAEACVTLSGAAVPYGKATAYHTIAAMMRPLFGIGDGFSRSEVLKRVQDGLVALDPSLGSLTRPLASILLAGEVDGDWAAQHPEMRRRQMIEACKRLVAYVVQHKPLVLAVEDLHWIDSESEAILDSLIDALPAMRLMLVVSFRPEYPVRWTGRSAYTQIRLGPLSSGEALSFLERLLGQDLSLSMLKPILIDQTGGNPLFIEQCFRALVQQGVLVSSGEGYRCTKAPERVQLPASVINVLMSRIDLLSPTCVTVLELAAIIGATVPLWLLEAVAEMRSEELQAALAEARQAEVLGEVRLFPDIEYAFRHALMRDAVLESILKRRQETIHRRIVEAIEHLPAAMIDENIERLALHASLGKLWEKAARYQEQAADRAVTHASYREAASHLQSMLDALGQLPQSLDTTRHLIDGTLKLRGLWSVLGTPHDTVLSALTKAEQLAERIGDRQRLAAAWTHISGQHWLTGDSMLALSYADRALAVAEQTGDPRLLAMALFRRGLALHFLGQHGEAVEVLQRTTDLLTGELEGERLGMSGLTAVFARSYMLVALSELGDFARARRISDEATALAVRSRDTYSILSAQIAMGYAATYQGDLETAIPLLTRALELTKMAQAIGVMVHISSVLGRALISAERFEEALPPLRFATDSDNQTSTQRLALPYLWYGEALVCSGDPATAHRMLEEARVVAEQGKDRSVFAWAHRLEGIIARHEGRFDAAMAAFETAIEAARRIGTRPLEAHARFDLALTLGRNGREADAAAAVAQARAIFEACGMALWVSRCDAFGIPLTPIQAA